MRWKQHQRHCQAHPHPPEPVDHLVTMALSKLPILARLPSGSRLGPSVSPPRVVVLAFLIPVLVRTTSLIRVGWSRETTEASGEASLSAAAAARVEVETGAPRKSTA